MTDSRSASLGGLPTQVSRRVPEQHTMYPLIDNLLSHLAYRGDTL
ncbi:hypothetical protein VPHK469_0220 [Vibrio phage K469]